MEIVFIYASKHRKTDRKTDMKTVDISISVNTALQVPGKNKRSSMRIMHFKLHEISDMQVGRDAIVMSLCIYTLPSDVLG